MSVNGAKRLTVTDQRIIDKINKLIAMAESPHVEEARTSAHLACKLIIKHGIKIGAITTQQTRSAQGVNWTGAGVDWSRMDELFRRAQAETNARAAARQQEAAQGTRVIRTRFNSTCSNCGKAIPLGDLCYWHLANRRVSCYPCCG